VLHEQGLRGEVRRGGAGRYGGAKEGEEYEQRQQRREQRRMVRTRRAPPVRSLSRIGVGRSAHDSPRKVIVWQVLDFADTKSADSARRRTHIDNTGIRLERASIV
jgi:hypothetical protein